MRDLTPGAGNGNELVYDHVEEHEQVTLPDVAANDQHTVENALTGSGNVDEDVAEVEAGYQQGGENVLSESGNVDPIEAGVGPGLPDQNMDAGDDGVEQDESGIHDENMDDAIVESDLVLSSVVVEVNQQEKLDGNNSC